MNMSTTNNLTQAAKERFLDVNRDLLALTTNGSNDVFRRISAALALDTDAQTDVMLYADLVDQKGHAGQIARQDFSEAMYKAICQSFVRIQKNLVVTWATKLTPEAEIQLEDIEIYAGEREPRPVVPPPPPPLSAAEQLEAEVINDWAHLPTAKVRLKCNNRAYREVFDRLMNSGALKSQCTTLYNAGEQQK
jgi:hypothetical protein